jgi:lipoyl(octanoyl) transferase
MIYSLYLGQMDYDESLRLQDELVERRRAGQVGDVLLLLEHSPVLTLGRHANRANILASDEMLSRRGVTLHQINRGGDVTFHGPGQLVGYPIFDLREFPAHAGGRMGPVDFVRRMEDALIGLCAVHGVQAGRIAGLTGVWCGDPEAHPGKIGAIGIHVSRGITSHGFAFNVTTDLSYFRLINPCGITDKPVTSLGLELEREGRPPVPGLEAVAAEAARQFGLVFARPVERLESLAALDRMAGKSAPMPEDQPLVVPAEVERLHGGPEKPVRA